VKDASAFCMVQNCQGSHHPFLNCHRRLLQMFKYLSTVAKSSLTMNLDLTKVLRFGDSHNHDADPTKVQEKSFLHRINQEVEKNPTLDPEQYYTQIFKESIQEVNSTQNDRNEEKKEEQIEEQSQDEKATDYLKFLPTKKKVLKAIRYKKSKTTEPLPNDVEDLRIEDTKYSKTLFDKNFLLHDSKDEDKVIILGSPDKVLYLAHTSHTFMDGTFSTSSDLYYQLFIIHGKVGKTVIPLCYIFLVSKKKNIYLKAFTALRAICLERNTEWKPQVITTDFETGLIAAIGEFFYGTQTKHKGCYFHYTQALRKNFVNCGLDKAEFKANVFHRRFYKSFKCLAFIHSLDLDDAFSQIKEAYYNKTPAESRQAWTAFCMYYQKTWLENKAYRDMFTYWKVKLDRTNNYAERWNKHFAQLVGRT